MLYSKKTAYMIFIVAIMAWSCQNFLSGPDDDGDTDKVICKIDKITTASTLNGETATYVIDYIWSGNTKSWSYSYSQADVTYYESGYEEYDSIDNIIESKIIAITTYSGITDTSITIVTYEYDADGRIDETTTTSIGYGDTTKYVTDYTWTDKTKSWSYLFSVSDITYYYSGYEKYDSNNNIAESNFSYTYTIFETTISSDATAIYDYDDNGRLIKVTMTTTVNGMTTTQVINYTWSDNTRSWSYSISGMSFSGYEKYDADSNLIELKISMVFSGYSLIALSTYTYICN